MSKEQSLRDVLDQAKEEEMKYDWLSAVKFYNEALTSVLRQKDFLKAGAIQEKIGFCMRRAAMQAESQNEFKERMQLGVVAYEKAREFYERLLNKQKDARIFRCDAIVNYLGYWLTSDPSEKKKYLDDCLKLERKALAGFLKSGEMKEYGETYSSLFLVFFYRVFLEWDRHTLKNILERGREWGEKAISELSKLGDSHKNAGIYFTLATCLSDAGFYLVAESEEIDTIRSKAVNYLKKAAEISEKNEDALFLGLSHLWLGINTGEEEAAEHHEKTLEYGSQTRDNFLIANGLDWLTYDTYWKAYSTEDPEKRRELVEKAMRFYESANHHFSIISFISPRGGFIGPPSGQAEHYYQMALWETNPEKREEFLETSEKLGMEALEVAESSDMPLVIAQVLHVISKTLQVQARVESNLQEKKRRLEKALTYRERTIIIQEQLAPFFYWNRGVMQNYLAGIKAELADIESSPESKRRLLEEAVVNKKESLNLCNKVMPYFERKGETTLFAALQVYQDTYATLLTRLYYLTKESEYLRRAIGILKGAIESANRLDMVSLIAESYWKIAKTLDVLGEHLRAAKNFEHSSENYIKAAEKVPHLKSFYHDHSYYMRAWNEIEKARFHHAGQQYGQAMKHYKKAATLHESTERWNYLSPNYSAWARLEEAEDLSRKEKTDEAKELFQQAATLFADTRMSIKIRIEKIQVRDEREMAAELVKASAIRIEYSNGRIALEEAKILERQGEYGASSRKFEAATRRFERAIKSMELESDRQELRPIISLCRAWQLMTKAEAESSPSLYLAASRLFDEAKELSFGENAKLLASGHSSFCKALEAGARFEAARDEAFYLSATRYLSTAQKSYVKAGFKTASEYAKATRRLFDAYHYIDNANKETAPEKRAKYYIMAEKVLQVSAGSYLKARYPAKSEEVRRLLESIKEERKLAVSLTEVLHAPTITSTTTSFVTPTPTHEEAVGLEKFEHATMEARITASEEVAVGQEFEVKLDVVNVAKNFGILVRVDDLVPPNFRITQLSPNCDLDDGALDMKGKKLAPLKIESVKLHFEAVSPGVVNLSPQIIFIDDLGSFKVSRPNPVTMTVHPKLTFDFKFKTTQEAFDFLVRSFVEDYMKKKLPLEKSGWRTLMQIVKKTKVPKSRVYGSGGRRGSALSELTRRGLIERRIFLGERGRGGKILRIRISYEKEPVRRHVDEYVMKKQKI